MIAVTSASSQNTEDSRYAMSESSMLEFVRILNGQSIDKATVEALPYDVLSSNLTLDELSPVKTETEPPFLCPSPSFLDSAGEEQQPFERVPSMFRKKLTSLSQSFFAHGSPNNDSVSSATEKRPHRSPQLSGDDVSSVRTKRSFGFPGMTSTLRKHKQVSANDTDREAAQTAPFEPASEPANDGPKEEVAKDKSSKKEPQAPLRKDMMGSEEIAKGAGPVSAKEPRKSILKFGAQQKSTESQNIADSSKKEGTESNKEKSETDTSKPATQISIRNPVANLGKKSPGTSSISSPAAASTHSGNANSPQASQKETKKEARKKKKQLCFDPKNDAEGKDHPDEKSATEQKTSRDESAATKQDSESNTKPPSQLNSPASQQAAKEKPSHSIIKGQQHTTRGVKEGEQCTEIIKHPVEIARQKPNSSPFVVTTATATSNKHSNLETSVLPLAVQLKAEEKPILSHSTLKLKPALKQPGTTRQAQTDKAASVKGWSGSWLRKSTSSLFPSLAKKPDTSGEAEGGTGNLSPMQRLTKLFSGPESSPNSISESAVFSPREPEHEATTTQSHRHGSIRFSNNSSHPSTLIQGTKAQGKRHKSLPLAFSTKERSSGRWKLKLKNAFTLKKPTKSAAPAGNSTSKKEARPNTVKTTKPILMKNKGPEKLRTAPVRGGTARAVPHHTKSAARL